MSDKTKVIKVFPLPSILTLIFVIAKIGGWIDWSWWVVFSPILAAWALVLLVIGGLVFLAVVAAILDKPFGGR